MNEEEKKKKAFSLECTNFSSAIPTYRVSRQVLKKSLNQTSPNFLTFSELLNMIGGIWLRLGRLLTQQSELKIWIFAAKKVK